MTKQKFVNYVKVQTSGVTNMWNSRYVCKEAKLTDEEYLDIIKNYEKYEQKYDVHVEEYE